MLSYRIFLVKETILNFNKNKIKKIVDKLECKNDTFGTCKAFPRVLSSNSLRVKS